MRFECTVKLNRLNRSFKQARVTTPNAATSRLTTAPWEKYTLKISSGSSIINGASRLRLTTSQSLDASTSTPTVKSTKKSSWKRLNLKNLSPKCSLGKELANSNRANLLNQSMTHKKGKGQPVALVKLHLQRNQKYLKKKTSRFLGSKV